MCIQVLQVFQLLATLPQSCKALQVKLNCEYSGRMLLIAAMGPSKQRSNEGRDTHLAVLPQGLHWPAAMRVAALTATEEGQSGAEITSATI